ncbi:MAG: PCP reductase family protein [Candidatus Omnitrophota bacterium]
MDMPWEKKTQEKFEQLIAKIPVFMRGIAQGKISQAAVEFARQNNHQEVIEKDMVDAFFQETPFAFQGLLKTDLESVGIDYTQYGHAK